MESKNINSRIKYWTETASHDYETMLGLFRIKRYSDSLFYGHIVLEKMLKAFVVKETGKDVPKTHNLSMLAELAGLELDKKEREFLAVVNRFNMRARYPDAKLSFYKLCTYEYAKDNITRIKKFYKKLCQELKPKK